MNAVSKKKRKKKRLTLREKKFIKYLPIATSMSEAMRLAGYSENYINSGERRELLQKPSIQSLMAEMGMDDKFCLTTLKEGFTANKVISAMVIDKKGQGISDANSMSKDFIEVPDYDCRHKYLTTGLKLRGHLNEKKDETEGRDINIQINYFTKDNKT